jgi:hypothetical protein
LTVLKPLAAVQRPAVQPHAEAVSHVRSFERHDHAIHGIHGIFLFVKFPGAQGREGWNVEKYGAITDREIP